MDATNETPAADAPEGDGTPEASKDDEKTEASAPVIEVPELPEDLTASEEAELRETFGALQSLYDEHRPKAGPTHVEAMRTIRERQAQIKAELDRRAEENANAAELLSQLDVTDLTIPDESPIPALASAAAVVAGREGQEPGEQSPISSLPRVAMVAAAGTAVAAAGTEMDLSMLGRAVDAHKQSRGVVRIASLAAYEEMPNGTVPELLSSDNSASRNSALIAETVDAWKAAQDTGRPKGARTAAICDPPEPIREIPDAFTAEERFSPIFPTRPAGRLAYAFTPSMLLDDVLGGSVIWTDTDQDNVDPTDPSTWKPCVEVECGSPEDVQAEAVTACLSFAIQTEMSSPERIRNAMNALMALRERNKEGRLLQLFDATASAYTFVGDYGALPALIEAINVMVAQATFANRLDDPRYTLVLDPMVTALCRVDRANRAYGVEAETSDVLDYVRGNVDGVSTIVETLDESAAGDEAGLPPLTLNTPGDAAIALPNITGPHRIRLVPAADYIYSETGELNVGVTRSPDLLRQNRSQFFSEEFFLFAKHGPTPAFTCDVNFCSDGARAGLVDPERCEIS